MSKKRNYGVVFLGLLMLAILLSGCNQKQSTLYVFNWGDYIDESVIGEFEKETGIRVVYDTYSTNEDMYVKIKAGGSNYDLLFPSDYMVKRMIDEDMLEKIEFKNVPNYEHISARFRNLEYDSKNEFSIPYMWGTVGILYNTTMVDEPVESWSILWDAKYRKQILMLDSQRDAIGVTLKMLGYSLNTTNLAELQAAGDALKEQKPLVLAYAVDEGKDKMVAEEAALAVVWSGDAFYAMRENSDLDYVIPQEGSNVWFDSMVIPKGSKNKANAEKFINFMLSPEIAFKNTDYTGYSTPHSKVMEMLDEDISQNKAAYPDDSDLSNSETFQNLGQMLRDYDRIWTEVKAL